MYKRCSNAAFAAGICIKDALLYLQQNNDFRINAACTSRFLGRKSIIITVSWCTTMQNVPHDQKQIVRKNLQKEKGQTPMTSVCPFQEKEDCEYGYCCTTYTGNDTGIFGTIIILCCSQALSTLISDFSEQKSQLCVRWFFCYSLMFSGCGEGHHGQIGSSEHDTKQIRLRTLP